MSRPVVNVSTSGAVTVDVSTSAVTAAQLAPVIDGAASTSSLSNTDKLAVVASGPTLEAITYGNFKTQLDALYVAKGSVTNGGLTQNTARILGRTTAGEGAVEEITVGTGLQLTGGELSATGGGGSASWSGLAGQPSDSTYISAFIETLLNDADAATAQATLGLGSMATQAASAVAITGGTVPTSTLTGNMPDARIVQSNVTQHQAALSIAATQLTGSLADARVVQSNVTQHQAALSVAASQLTGTLADARVAESNVTQHEAALSIAASQLSSLSSLDAADLGSGAATDGYVLTADGAGGAAWEGSSTDWGDIGGTLSDQTDLQTALDAKLNAASVSTFGASLVDDADAAAARTTLGLGTMATQAADNVAITGGTLSGITSLILDELPPGPPAALGEGQIKFANNQIVYGNGTVNQTVAALAETQTLTNKTISGASNTITNVSLSTGVTGTLPVANGGTGQTSLASVDAADFGAGASADGQVLMSDGSAGAAWEALPCEIGVACSDETTALTSGTAKVTFRMPYAMTLTAVRASVTTAPTGSTLILDINEAGSSVLSTKMSIDATEKTSTTAATAAVISDSALADDAEITIDIDQIGSSTAGAGLKVWLIGTRA